MALYTMISKNQALNPLKNYKGNDSYARNQMAAFGFGPSVKQTEIYDTLARDSGSSNKNPDSSPNDNFFTKKLKSVENAIGTTFAAAVGGINEGIERQRQDNDAKEYNQKLENILTQAGYNSIDDYYDDKDATEKEIFGKYGLDMDDWQTKRSDAWGASPTAIDQATVDKLDQERQNIKNLMNEEDLAKINRLDDIENARQAENSAYRNKIQQASENYKDYVNNSYIGQKINQDPGKFAGSAMNTLSTATDILLPGAGVVFNAAQGAWEGLADELEENGLQNFDWNRAGQNMLTGAATGGITGILNKGISNKLAQNGGNLFKGGNKLTQAINNTGSNTALGRVGSTLATGAGRGAVSGAVGGATGAGLSAAMNGQDVLESAIQGAQQGFGQGALTGGIMAGANILASKTPGVSVAMQKLNEAGEDWNTRKANGENFGERLTNTWDESTTKALGSKVANSRLGNRIGEDINAIKQGFQDVGQGLNVLANRSGIKDIAQLDVRDLPNILRGNGNEAVLQQLAKNPELRNQLIDDIDNSQVSLNENMADRSQRDFTSGIDKVTRAFDESSNQKVIANRNGLEFSLGDFGNESLSRKVSKDNSHGLSEAEIANIIKSSDRQSVAGDSSFRKDNVAWFGDLPDGSRGTVITRKNGLGQEEIINAYKNNPGYEAELVGKFGTPAQSRTGNLGLEDQSIESTIQGRDLSNTSDTSKLHDNLSISQNDQNVNTFPEDIQTMKITDATNTPETEVYRVLTGDDNNRTNGDYLTSSEYKHRQRRNEKLLEQYGTLSRRVTQASQPAKTVGEMADIGFTKPQDVEAAIKYVTGTGGKLNILNQKVVQNASPVSTWDGTEPGQSMSDYIDTQIRLNGLYGTSDGKALTAEINAQLERLPSRRSGSIDFKDAPEDVFSVVQALEKHSANYKGKSGTNYSTSTPYKEQKAVVLDSVAQVLKDRIYDNADISKVVTPEVITEMKQAFPDNNKWASWVDNNVATAKTGKDLRSAQAPFVRMSKILNEAENNAGTFGQKMGNFAKTMATSNPLGMIVNGAKILADTNIGRRAMASVEDYLANRSSNKNSGAQGISRGAASNTAANEANDSISASNADYNPATQIYNMIGRAEGLSNAEQARTADYLVDAAQEAEIVPNSDTIKDVDSGTTILPNDTSSTSIYNALTGEITNGQASITQGPVQFSNSYPSTTGDYWTDIIGNAMMAAAEANDVNAFAALYEMYQNASSNASSNSEAKTVSDLNATQQNQLAKLETASSAIDELEALYDNAGGGKGVIFGNLQNIGGSLGLDSNARTYSKMAEGLVNQIAQAIGKTDSLNTEGEVQRALQLIPQLTDDAQTAKNKLEFLRRMLQETTSNYLSAYGVQ